MKRTIKWNSIFGILLFILFINQTSCSSHSEGDSKTISATIHEGVNINSTCNDDGGEVDNFGIIGGKTISQKSPLARGVVKLYSQFYDSSDKFVSGGACTGALIDSNIILTAAHCIQAPEDVVRKGGGSLRQKVYVLYGSNPFCRVDQGDYSRLYLVDSMKVHEDFGKGGGNGDIALLRIEKPMAGERTYYKLEAKTHDFKADENLIAVGYGKNKGYSVKEESDSPLKLAMLGSNKKESFANEFIRRLFNFIPADKKKKLYDDFESELKKNNQQAERASIEVVADDYIKKSFKELYLNYSDSNENLLFDQSNNEGVCAGDSGGPGLRSVNGSLRIVGVAKSVSAYNSHDDSCSFSTIYTNVSFHKAWIIKNFNALSNQNTLVRRQGELLFE